MNLSTEPSIETLPEFYANGANVVDMNVINDQTIANYCSDTVRELNNLTEELQQTDLDEIGIRANSDNQISSFNSSSFKRVHGDADAAAAAASVQCYGDSKSNAHSSIADHNYSIPLHSGTLINNEKMSTETEIGNLNCDVVDSSPFYTHFNTHLENNMDDDVMNRVSADSLHHSRETNGFTNGSCSSEESRDNEYRMAMCMLQSVDLRGKHNTIPSF